MSATTPGSMTVECSTCGHEYRPTRDQIIAGVWRKACPVCFPVEERARGPDALGPIDDCDADDWTTDDEGKLTT